MPFAYWMLIAAAMLPYFTIALAKSSGGIDHRAPRPSLESRLTARAYLAHPILGPRLELRTRIVLEPEAGPLHEIFGSPDDMKVQSSMTLFALAAANPDSLFYQALDRSCSGSPDPQTLKLLETNDR